MAFFEKRAGAHYKRAVYSIPLLDEFFHFFGRIKIRLQSTIAETRYKIWQFMNRREIRRYGEFTVRQAAKKGISPFDEYYGGGKRDLRNAR